MDRYHIIGWNIGFITVHKKQEKAIGEEGAVQKLLLDKVRNKEKKNRRILMRDSLVTFEAHGRGLEQKCLFAREFPCQHRYEP